MEASSIRSEKVDLMCSSVEKMDSDPNMDFHPKAEDTRSWTCECFPDYRPPMSTGVPPKPLPPFPDACTCYGLPEPFLKPGPKAGYLGMGYPPPGFSSPAFLRTPGYSVPKPKQEYTAIPCGRGLIPPCGPEDLMIHSQVVQNFIIKGSDGFQVEVTEYGARVMSIRAPDVDGTVGEVLLGFDCPGEYWNHKKLHWGGVVGRLADRVSGPEPHLRVRGVGDFLLDENDNEDHYMGGLIGLDRVVWNSHLQSDGVLFTYLSPAEEDRYPGDLLVSVLYRVIPNNQLVVHMEAVATRPTPLALTVPLAFNLAGHDTGETGMKDHVVILHAEKYYVTNELKRPTGAKRSVRGSAYDMRIPRDLKKIIPFAPDECYDVLLCARDLQEGEKQCLMAKLYHPGTRRVLEVWSDLPVLHFATDLGLLPRPQSPSDPALVQQAQSVLHEVLLRMPSRDGAPGQERVENGGGDQPTPQQALQSLYQNRAPPNPGYISTLPEHKENSSEMVVAAVLEDIMERVRTPPPQYIGFGGTKYYNDSGILLSPQMQPLLPNKSNTDGLVLRPGQRYSRTVTYAFGVLERRTRGRRRRWGRTHPHKIKEEHMIDQCSAASSLEIKEESFTEIHDACSEKDFHAVLSL